MSTGSRHFYDLIYKNDRNKILRVKLVQKNYNPNVHDFVFTYNKDNALLFYYILKDSAEEKNYNHA